MLGGSNSQYLPPHGVGQPGAPVQGGGGSGNNSLNPLGRMPIPFRDPVDAARSMMGARTPSAEYPDGYLGTIQSRREDRLLDSLKNNLNQRAYQRGVHKGEKINPDDYFWPGEFTPDDGLLRGFDAVPDNSTGVMVYHVDRPSPRMTVSERLTVLGSRGVRGAELITADPRSVSNLDRLRPAWS